MHVHPKAKLGPAGRLASIGADLLVEVPSTVAGMAKVLVTGMSGTGKSSALAELGRRGYRVVDTDNPGWTAWVASEDEVGGGEWLWAEDRMTELLRLNDVAAYSFRAVCGIKRSSTTGSTRSYCSVPQSR